MSEVAKLEMSEDEKLKLSRYVIITASIGFITTGLYTVYRMKFMDKSTRAMMTLLAGLPIGYGLSQLVNDQFRQINQDEKKDES